ncbi:hypothetical protein [Streptomyces qinglanensis]|uniref:hypothetical protein n=1 Tax=Streptomyces qinglanensis TaxID=943816 RepID=UPI003D748014
MTDIQIRVQSVTAPDSDAYDLRLATGEAYADMEAAMVRALREVVERDPDRHVVSAQRQTTAVEEITGV